MLERNIRVFFSLIKDIYKNLKAHITLSCKLNASEQRRSEKSSHILKVLSINIKRQKKKYIQIQGNNQIFFLKLNMIICLEILGGESCVQLN